MENNKMNSFMSPKLSMAFGVLVFGALIISILTFVSSGSKGAEVGWGILFAILIAGLIFSSFALYLSTRLVKVPEGSFARAMVFNSGLTLILCVLASLLILIGVPVALVFVIDIVIMIMLMRWYYKVSVMRSFGIFLIDVVISGIMAFIVFIVTAALGLGILMSIFTGFSKEVDTSIENSVTDYNAPLGSTSTDQQNTQNIAPSNDPGNSVANPGTTLSASQVEQVKKMFPKGFVLPADSQIKFTKDQSLPDTYELEYVASGTIKATISLYESLFKKAGYGYINGMPFDNDGSLVAQKETHAVGNTDFRFDFLNKGSGSVEVKVSIHEWK